MRSQLWDYVARCEAAGSLDELGALFVGEMAKLGFAHVALCSHVDPLNPPPEAVAIFAYPANWLAHFSAEGYQEFDPVFMAARARAFPFQWRDPEFRRDLDPNQQRVLAEGADAGLEDGFTIPIQSPGALPASCSLVAGPGGADPLNFSFAHSMAVLTHERARLLQGAQAHSPPIKLAPREMQCLTLAARGKSDWVAGELLGIGERAVHRAVERAKRRLGVATRVQAIVRALALGLIDIKDIAD